MKAFGVSGRGRLEVFEKNTPTFGAYDAIVTPLAAGFYNPAIYQELTANAATGAGGAAGDGFVVGHESAGIIVEVGPEVTDFRVGDRVAVPTITPDWRTLDAQDIAWPQHAGGVMDGWKLGISEDGVLAEQFVVRDADMNLAHLPENVSPLQAAMLSDMGLTASHAAELAGVGVGDTVAVIALGGVGQMALEAARVRGAARIIGIDGRDIGFRVAQEGPVTDLVDFREGSTVEQVLELTGGRGVDRTIVAGGGASVINDAFAMTKIGGSIGSTTHIAGENITIEAGAWIEGLAHKSFNAGLTDGGRVRMARLLALVQYGRMDPSRIITHTIEGFEGIPAAMRWFEEDEADILRAAITFE